MNNQYIDETTERMEKAIDSLRRDLATIRTGRANASLLDTIHFEYYGVTTPLKQAANISTPDVRTISIQPWDKTTIGEIEKAIQRSDLGLTPNNDGTVIRLNIPMLTEERRKELSKIAKRMGEEAKVAIRNIRRDVNDELKKQEKEKLISEDDSHRTLDEIQKVTDKFVAKIDDITDHKEQEIMEI
jgi:ribosome recycling factor